jgi:predicted membrane channel-forming protein YqfA (hemolysin III family)
MLLADGIGIIAGVVLGKHIPQRTIKWVSATIFLIFGLVGIYEAISSKIGLAYTALTLTSLIVFSILAIIFITRKQTKQKT